MSGHGCPPSSPARRAHRSALQTGIFRRCLTVGWGVRALTGLLVIATVGCLTLAYAQEAPSNDILDLELRIAMGGGAPQAWSGSIGVDEGEVSLVRLLGLEPDTPGSARVVEGKLIFAQRSPHGYDGVDLAVRGSRNAKVIIDTLAAGVSKRVEIPLSELISGVHNSALDEQQNRLLVRRTPGDRLRLVLERDSLVFDTGEQFRFSVQPHEAGLPTDTALRCRVRLLDIHNEEAWNSEIDFRLARGAAEPTLGPYECPLPEAEGVYRLVIEIVTPPRLGVALVHRKPLVTREIQLVALAATPPVADETPLVTTLEIDPAHPGWLDRLTKLTKLTSIPGFATRQSLSNGRSSTVDHGGERVVQLTAGGWQAYPLPLKNIGQPHVLEVEYPQDATQALGISLVEPNAAGQIAPLGVDSGVTAVTTTVDAGPGMVKHRLVFWPRTKTPLVLLTNRHAKQPALFGKLRVLAGPQHLPAASPPSGARGRLLAAYYDKPLFAENFGAGEALDPTTNRTLDDWNTFFLGARRMIEELKYAGYNGAVISVACEGSTLYPSQLLDPTPKYDMGLFFGSGQDPLRKDVLEMLFRLFNREGLQLIPAIQFATPLPEIEELRLGEEADGLELIGPEGLGLVAARGTRRGLAPYYNPLDERVRLAMRRVVDEISERYAHHEAFAGISLQLSPETYVQLPGEEWGYDDRTLARFTRDTKKTVAMTGPNRFADRAQQLQGADSEAWLAWRAKQITTLYTMVQRDLVRRRGNAKLYLAAGEMLHSDTLERQLRPTLPGKLKLRDALLAIGVDPQLLRSESNIVFLRPQRELAPGELAAKASYIEVNRSAELDDAMLKTASSGVHLFHEPATLRMADFDAVSPFGSDKTHLFLATQFSPSQHDARRNFVRSLAAFDPQTVVQGGWMLPLGQEDSTRAMLTTYQQLPPVRFTDVPSDTSAIHPVVVRSAVHDSAAFVYVVNPSPWPVSVQLQLADPDQATWAALDGREVNATPGSDGLQAFALELAPHDLVALKASSPRASVAAWKASMPPTVQDELRKRIERLRAKTIALRSAKPMDLLGNADFEKPRVKEAAPQWIHATDPGVAVSVDRADARGTQSLHVKSSGAVAWVRSDPFPVPSTGRLSVWVWLKIKDPQTQPPLRLAIEARHREKTYYRFASVGAGSTSTPLKGQWAPYLFQVDDLPTIDVTDLRVGFDLMGAGEVWIDDVQVFDTYFHDHEQDELLKMIALADLQLGKGNVGDCQKVLDGYWARFIDEHVAMPALPRVAEAPPAAQTPAAEATAEKNGLRDKVWNWVPKWR